MEGSDGVIFARSFQEGNSSADNSPERSGFILTVNSRDLSWSRFLSTTSCIRTGPDAKRKKNEDGKLYLPFFGGLHPGITGRRGTPGEDLHGVPTTPVACVIERPRFLKVISKTLPANRRPGQRVTNSAEAKNPRSTKGSIVHIALLVHSRTYI